MGDMSFSGGFETMAAGKDTEGWMDVVSVNALISTYDYLYIFFSFRPVFYLLEVSSIRWLVFISTNSF